MKRIAFGAAVLLAAGMTSPLLAADLPVKAPPPVVAAPTWTGCYIGINAGVNYGHTNGFITTDQTNLGNRPGTQLNPGVNDTGGFDVKPGVLVGGYGGCNYQFSSRFVIGAEVDGGYAWKSSWAKLVPNGTALNGGFGNVNDLWEISERALVTARARLGYAVTDRWLLYVTGGGAWGKVETFETITTAPIPSETWFQEHWRSGWTVGAGTEYMVGGGWTVRGEFLYVDLGSWRTFTNIPNPAVQGGPGFDTFTNMKVNLVDYIGRVGLHYKFDWPGTAVVATY